MTGQPDRWSASRAEPGTDAGEGGIRPGPDATKAAGLPTEPGGDVDQAAAASLEMERPTPDGNLGVDVAAAEAPVAPPVAPEADVPAAGALTAGLERIQSPICPYLESASGRWRQASPSRDHRCTALRPPAPLTVDKQRRLCLGPAHVTCPAFLAAVDARRAWSGLPIAAAGAGGRAALPPEAFANRWGLTRTAPIVVRPVGRGFAFQATRHQRILAQAGLVGALLIAFAAIAFARLPGNDGGALLVPTPTLTPVPTAPPTPTPSPTPTPEITLPPTPEPTPVATPAPTSSTTTYRVVSGDTLTGIAARFGTTVRAIMDLNGLTTTSLRIGQLLRIPAPSGP